MRVIPAIDLLHGKCVRLTQGHYQDSKIYADDPLEVAKAFEGAGLRYLHLVDLEGARSHHVVHYKILEKIATRTSLIIDFGGGIKSDLDVRIALESGAAQITAGSLAVTNTALFLAWLEELGPDVLLLGADAKDRKIAVSGWTEMSDHDIIEWIRFFEEKGIRNVVCTDISKDGMLDGPAVGLYADIINASRVNLIASGGIRDLADLDVLKKTGCEGAIIGKALYEGRISLPDLAGWQFNHI